MDISLAWTYANFRAFSLFHLPELMKMKKFESLCKISWCSGSGCSSKSHHRTCYRCSNYCMRITMAGVSTRGVMSGVKVPSHWCFLLSAHHVLFSFRLSCRFWDTSYTRLALLVIDVLVWFHIVWNRGNSAIDLNQGMCVWMIGRRSTHWTQPSWRPWVTWAYVAWWHHGVEDSDQDQDQDQ